MNENTKPIRQPCVVCRNHKGGAPIKIRADHGGQVAVTHIAHCPYCGRFLSENYQKEDKT